MNLVDDSEQGDRSLLSRDTKKALKSERGPAELPPRAFMVYLL